MCGRSTSILQFNLGSSPLGLPAVSTQHAPLYLGGVGVNFTSSYLSYTRKPTYSTTHLINEYRSISGSSFIIHNYDYMYAFKSGRT